jgi:hypothetical protein
MPLPAPAMSAASRAWISFGYCSKYRSYGIYLLAFAPDISRPERLRFARRPSQAGRDLHDPLLGGIYLPQRRLGRVEKQFGNVTIRSPPN